MVSSFAYARFVSIVPVSISLRLYLLTLALASGLLVVSVNGVYAV